jgi:hypothetical protein
MFKKIVLLLAALLICSVTVMSLTRNISWNPKERPRMQLAQAMQLAHESLNAQEGLDAGDDKFYCISAMLAITTSKDGDWTFRFGSKEGGQRWVIVDFERRVEIRQEPPEEY